MKRDNNIDRKIQNILFEKRNNVFDSKYQDSEDSELYQIIGNELSEEPQFSLDSDFAVDVTKKAIRRKKAGFALKVLLTYAAIISILILVGGTAFYFLAKDTFKDLLRLAADYNLQIIFSVLLVLAIQLIDKILVQKQSNVNVID